MATTQNKAKIITVKLEPSSLLNVSQCICSFTLITEALRLVTNAPSNYEMNGCYSESALVGIDSTFY